MIVEDKACIAQEIVSGLANHFASRGYLLHESDKQTMFNGKRPTQSIRSGGPSEFDDLYQSFAPRVQAYLLRLTGGKRTEAEDLTQETFLAAYATRKTFAGSNILAWLFGIARRRQRDAFRAAGARPPTTPLDTVVEIGAYANLDESTARRVTLAKSLDTLSAPEREAIVLVVIQGLTYAEAATIMNDPVGTVKWRVHTGTRQLRKLLSGTFAEEFGTQESRKESAPHVEIDQSKRAAI